MSVSPQSSAEPRAGTLGELLRAELADSDLSPTARTLLLEAFAEDTAPGATPKTAYLRSVTVRGFRGIGRESRLEIAPKPGLTLVTGANGSGKSSFAEGIEIALTGDNARWKARSDIWRRSWRNLHHGDAPRVDVELFLPDESGEATIATVRRTWSGEPGGDVGDSQAEILRAGASTQPLSWLGWAEDLSLYRPFLSYSELGQVISGRPSEMYDAVATILGLETLTTADKRLRERAKALDDAIKRAAAEKPGLLEEAEALDDSRAREAAGALRGKNPDLARLRSRVTGQEPPGDAELAALRRLSELAGPHPNAVAEVANRLRSAAAAGARVRGTSTELARKRADLMERALAHHRDHPQERACPVCAAPERIDARWAEETAAQVDSLRAEAAQAEAARREVGEAMEAARRLVQNPPPWLPSDLSALWRPWLACRDLTEPEAMAERLESTAAELAGKCARIREDAAARLAALDHRWLGLAGKLAGWVARAEEAEAGRGELAEVKKARAWLRQAHDRLRDERMRPFAETSQLYWSLLRQQSSVELGGVRLAGASTHRKVMLDVAVDNIEAPALGVMSQGELHSLALSLFLPRAATPQSPFRFLVIDDPVQSMDQAKVDGLARVLATVAERRQVVVFTHDARLADTVRYQRLPATILEVSRGENSRVGVSANTDPVKRLLDEAEELIKDRGITEEVLSRVLPGLCRNALEAAFLEPVWRRLLDEGRGHAEIAERIGRARRLAELAALALYGDSQRHREVIPHLRQEYGAWAADLVTECNKGAHEPIRIPNPRRFLTETAQLARKVRAL